MQNENQLDENMEWVGSDVFNKQINRDTYWQLLSEKCDPIPLPKKSQVSRTAKIQEQQKEVTQKPLYKFFVSKGNNRNSLRRLMNGRHWWQEYSKQDMDKVNFMWT